MSVQGLTTIRDSTLHLSVNGGNSRVRAATREGAASADQLSLSAEALSAQSLNVAAEDGIRNNRVFARFGEDTVVFDNASGSISWGGTKLQLKAVGNALKDDLIVEKVDDGFRVMNVTDGTQLFLDANGKARKNSCGIPDVTLGFEGPVERGALFISNQEWASNGTGKDDVLINRRAGAEVYAGSGNDKIFNLNSRLKSINAMTGDNAVYSVGLRAGASIDTSSGNGYVKLSGMVQGATISMGTGRNVLDAKGKTFTNSVLRTEKDAASSIVLAGTVNGGTLNVLGENAAVDAKRLVNTALTFGSGANSLVADTVTGTGGLKTRIEAGENSRNTFRIGTLKNAEVDVSNSADNVLALRRNVTDATILLGAGNNVVDAGKATLHRTVITAAPPDESDSANGGTATTGGSTVISAGRITGDPGRQSEIRLNGGGNTVEVAGAVRNAVIDLGTGANTFKAKSVNNLSLTAGGEDSDAEQNILVKGNVVNMNYTGSRGTDTLAVHGSMRGGSMVLGEGDNSLVVQKAVAETDISAEGTAATTLHAASYRGKNGAGINLGDGGNTLRIQGRVSDADISLGAGANTFLSGSLSGKYGVTLSMDTAGTHSQTVTITGSAKNFIYAGGNGDDALTVHGNLTDSEVDLGEGTNSLHVGMGSRGGQLRGVSVSAYGSGSTTVRANAIRNGVNQYTRVSLGDGGNSLLISRTVNGGTDIDLGAGANVFRSGSILGTANRSVELTAGGSGNTAAQDVAVYGRASHFTYNGSDGLDSVIVRDGTKNSRFDLGYGDRALSIPNLKDVEVSYRDGPHPDENDADSGIGGLPDDNPVGFPDDETEIPDGLPSTVSA